MATQGITNIIKRDGSIVPYRRPVIRNAIYKAMQATGQSNKKTAGTLAGMVEQALTETITPGSFPSVEEIQDVVESTLMKEGQLNVARRYIIYRHERARARSGTPPQFHVTDHIPYKKIYEVLLWNLNHGCDSIETLNRTISDGHFPELVLAAEDRYSSEVAAAAEQALSRGSELRMIVVAGPSSSGKTTTTIKVCDTLKRAGLAVRTINIDNYFFNLVDHPQDEFGDYDYETPQALDLALINQHVAALLDGQAIMTPDYNFKTGMRTLEAHPMKLGKDEILIIDSLHGLYADMTSLVPDEHKFSIYVETLGQLRDDGGHYMRWADNRLLRRMIRDKHHRNTRPMETLTHWHYVRRSELKHIIPFIASADAVINTALPYELPVLKSLLFRYFAPALKRYKEDPHRLDAYIRASRLHEFMTQLKTIKESPDIPATSLLREFIGGSQYRY